MGPVECDIGSIHVNVVLDQEVINFQHIAQVVPHCSISSSYTTTANCTPGAKSAVCDCLVFCMQVSTFVHEGAFQCATLREERRRLFVGVTRCDRMKEGSSSTRQVAQTSSQSHGRLRRITRPTSWQLAVTVLLTTTKSAQLTVFRRPTEQLQT